MGLNLVGCISLVKLVVPLDVFFRLFSFEMRTIVESIEVGLSSVCCQLFGILSAWLAFLLSSP